MKKTKVAIASESAYTVEAGAQIAELGGNAVDIAVAAALAAAVSEALMCSLGGSAFVSIKIPGESPELIDGADAMPDVPQNRVEEIMAFWKTADVAYGDGISVHVGHSSIAIPGMLKALELAWKKHGSLPWKEIVEPALALARSGVKANSTLAIWLGLAGKAIFYDQPDSRKAYFVDERPLKRDEHYKIDHLSDTFELIAREGSRALYEGDLAKALSEEILDNGGFVTRKNLADYRAIERKPIVLSTQGYNLSLNPPPAIGGAMVGSMIQMFEGIWSKDLTDAKKVLRIAEIQKTMLSLREQEAHGDWSNERANFILEKEWLKKFFGKAQSPNTMHLSVATGDGSVVSITMSNGYGSGITIPKTGIPCNNSLGEPELNPRGFFAIQPGNRVVSNMSPMVAWNNEGTTLAMGSPGASRITTSLFQTWVRFAFEGLSFEESVLAPRLHMEPMQGELLLQYEPGIDVDLVKDKYKLSYFTKKDMYFGSVNIAGSDAKGRLHALADIRRFGNQHIDDNPKVKKGN